MTRWCPVLAGVGVLIATMLLWKMLTAHEHAEHERMAEFAATSVKNQIIAQMHSRVLALVRMAKRWEVHGKPSQAEWESDARLYVDHYKGLPSLSWVDPAFHIRWIVPHEGNGGVQEMELGLDDRRRTALDAARERREVTATPVIDLAQGGKGFMVNVPIWRGEEFGGFIVGAFQMQELLDAIFDKGAAFGRYSIAIFEGRDKIYSRERANERHEDNLSQETQLDLYGIAWRVRVWPTPECMRETQSYLPEATLIAGVIVAALLAMALHLARTARLRAREVAATSRELETEIAERKRAEAKVVRYNEELEELVNKRTLRIHELERQQAEAEKISATGRMAARIAHEINNPLAGIKNSFLLIKKAVAADHPYRSYVDRIDKEIARIARIVRQMFDLYRPEQETPHEFKVDETIRDIVALLEASCNEHGVKIIIELPEVPIVVLLPEDSVRQVLFNIIQNAIEASPHNDLVKIATCLTEQRLTVTVSDQGNGIPKEVSARIFEPFFTTKNGHINKGLGLGISISKSMVEAMGGSIDFTSEAGRGTVFSITLPLHKNEAGGGRR